jgi:cytochrome bd-type quinol oxidase subunit 2
MTSMSFDELLPLIFIGLMGVSLLVYVVSDGYDLGVGMLMHRATPGERDTMVASIGPFWDANETWLVLGVGLLLIAFPKAHGLVLSELYLPTALMLVGLILRGAAFDFRVKGKASRKAMWTGCSSPDQCLRPCVRGGCSVAISAASVRAGTTRSLQPRLRWRCRWHTRCLARHGW